MKRTKVIAGIILICIGPLIVLTGVAYTLMLPNIYASRVRISVQEEAPQINPFDSGSTNYPVYNPNFLRTQIEVIQSAPVLYTVINRLNLQEEWGMDGECLPREVALRILENSIEVFHHPDTTLFAITCKRPDPDEAARIANELAVTYRDSRLDIEMRKVRETLQNLDGILREQAQRVLDAEKRVQEVPVQYVLPAFPNDDSEGKNLDQSVNSQNRCPAMMDLEKERLIYKQLAERLRTEIVSSVVPRSPVELIDIAEPNRRPVSPNLFLNALVSLAVGGGVAVVGIVLLVMGLQKKRA